MKAPYGLRNPSSASDVIEGRLVDIALRALELGINMVVDYGLWGRDERSAFRQAAADLGAEVQLHYFDVTPAEQRKRLDQRHAKEPHTTWRMSDVELAEWAAIITIPTRGELDGSEPIDDPPAGSRLGTSAQASLAAIDLLRPPCQPSSRSARPPAPDWRPG